VQPFTNELTEIEERLLREIRLAITGKIAFKRLLTSKVAERLGGSWDVTKGEIPGKVARNFVKGPPWSPATRALKTRKPGPRDQVSNTGYPSEASPKSALGWWAGLESNQHSFRGGFTAAGLGVHGRPPSSF